MANGAVHTVATSVALEIDGKFAGFLSGVDGGDAFAEVIEAPDTGGPTDKSIGKAQYEDITVTCLFPDDTLAAWVAGFLEGKAPEHDGAVTFFNVNQQPVRRLEWQQGSMVSVTFPGFDDTQGKTAGRLRIAIRPTTTKDVGGGGKVPPIPPVMTKKDWDTGNAALTMPGIDCTRVIRVEPIVVTQTYLASASGRVGVKPGPVRVSDLVVTVNPTGASDFVRWAEDFIVAGNATKSDEKDATIRYLTRDLRGDVARLNVLSTGIFRVDHESQEVNLAKSIHVKFSMYAEQVQWVKGTESVVPPATPTAQPGTDRNLRDVLGKRLAPAEVVRRLQEEPASEQRPYGVENQRQLGREVGLAWAQRHASLTELREVAAADDQDWSSLSFPEGHSLAETLAATVDIPLLYDGSLQLPRDALAEGLLSGVQEALAEVNDQLDLRSR